MSNAAVGSPYKVWNWQQQLLKYLRSLSRHVVSRPRTACVLSSKLIFNVPYSRMDCSDVFSLLVHKVQSVIPAMKWWLVSGRIYDDKKTLHQPLQLTVFLGQFCQISKRVCKIPQLTVAKLSKFCCS